MISPHEPPGGQRCSLPHLARPLDSANHFGVGMSGEAVCIMLLPVRWLARDESILLAAWLTVIADPDGREIARVIAEIKKT